MGDPTTAERGIADRGTSNRLHAPVEPPKDTKPFSEHWLGLQGAGVIPDVLAHGLIWQLELDALQREPIESRQEMAEKLLKLWEFLKQMETEMPRDPKDSALLVADALKVMSQAKGTVQLIELPSGESIPVVEDWQDPVLPPWAPSHFPQEMTAEQQARYPQRPKRVDDIPPFYPDNVSQWTALRDYQPAAPPPEPRKPRAKRGETGEYIKPLPIVDQEAKVPDNETSLQEALDKALDRADHALRHAKLSSAVKGPTPLVDGAIRTLSELTLNDIERKTKVTFDPKFADTKLINSTEIILYHSVYTVLLDRHGNPIDLFGRVHYSILVPAPGSQMQRNIPPPGAVYVSVQKYGYSNFRIKGANIEKVLFGGVGGFVEYGYGYSGPHFFQKKIQGYLDDMGHSYIASVTAEGAYNRKEITAKRLWNEIPEFITATLPYTVAEITKRIEARIENLDGFLKEIGEQAIRSLIEDTIREKIKDYIGNKVAKKVLPLVNLAFAVYDLVAGEEERIRLRHAIACMIMALKGITDEDVTIAAKVMSKIMADEFEDKVIEALVKQAVKHGKKLTLRKEPKSPEPKKADHPADQPEPPKADADVEPTAAADQPPAAQKKPYDPLTDSTRRELAEAERLAQTTKAHQATLAGKPDVKSVPLAHKTGDKATRDTAATEANRATGDKVAAASTQASTPTTDTAAAAAGGGAPPRGTLEQPRRIDPVPPPALPTVAVKGQEELPEGTHKEVDRPNQPTRRTSHEQALRAERERERGLTPLDHDSHHVAMKKGPSRRGRLRQLARRAQELLSIAGVSIDDEANEHAARGLPRDPRAPTESASQHWNQHSVKNMEALVRDLEKVRGDTDATREVLRKHSRRMEEDRKIEEEEFRLGPDDEPDEPDYDDPDEPPPPPPRPRGPRR